MNPGRSFLHYYRLAIGKPTTAFMQLTSEKNALKYAAMAVSIQAVLYTMVYVFLIFGGGQPFKPWLDIPLESYYHYNVFFCAPSMFLGWILAAGVVHVIGRTIATTGTFEGTLCVLGFGIGIASWATGFHDIITSFLGAVGIIDQRNYEVALNSPTIWRTLLWIQMMAYLIASMFFFYKGIRVIYGVNTSHAILLSTLGFIVYQLFFLIFNR